MAVARSFDSVYRALNQGELAPVYYLTGDEDVLKDELISCLVDRATDPGSRDFNLDVRSAADVNAESLHTLVETPPMLAERRVVVIKNLEQWRGNAKVWKVLDRYLAQPSPTTVLVLTHGPGVQQRKALAGSTMHVVCAALDPSRLQRWTMRRAKQTGIELPAEAARHLVGAVGNNLSLLGTEIDKLGAAAPGGAVDVDLVSAMVGIRRGETLHDWVDAVLLRDTLRAVSMLEAVLAGSGVSGVRLVNTLGTGLIGVRIARAQLDLGRNERQAGEVVFNALRTSRPFGTRNWRDDAALWTRAATRWTTAELSAALESAYECDRALKSTTVTDERGTLVHMILRVSRIQEAA